MNDPPSVVNENVIDIFILSMDETVALQLKEQLEQRDYRVTVFSDNAHLKETLHSGKPNLLICNTSTGEPEGFDICHQIKADNDLWVIPVLILTTASTLGDLLNVLDSNADNFIAQPYDLPYFLLLIEGMLTTPVEQPTPDQNKTQFRISHDDRTYVVGANRRKLLEYLLSAFEIAINKSSELSRQSSDLSTLSELVKEQKKSITGHANVIELLNATIQQKEQKIIALKRECEESGQALTQKNTEIGNLVKERDADKDLITAQDETLRTLTRKQDEDQIAYRSKTDELTRHISAVTEESEVKKAGLEAIQHTLSEETTRCASLEKTLRALTLEHEQQKSAFNAEKNRAISAEQEVEAVLQAKTQSEQDLTRIITDLNETAKQQAAELIRFRSELDALNQQAGKLKENLAASSAALDNDESVIKLQKEQLAEMIAEKEKAKEQLQSVLQELSQAQSAVASGEEKRKSIVNNLEEVIAGKERSEQKTTTLSAALDAAQYEIEAERVRRRTVEETLERTTRERDDALMALRREYEGIQTDLDSHKVTLAQRERDLDATKAIRETLEGDLDAQKARNKALEEDLDKAAQYRAQSGQQSRSLADDLEQVKAALETERRLRRISEEKAKSATQRQEDLEQHLRSANEEMERAKKDRESAVLRFKEELKTAGNQIQSLEEQAKTHEREKIPDGPASIHERTDTTVENLQLVISEEPSLPVPVEKVSQSLTTGTLPAGLHPSGESSKDIPRVFSGVIPRVPDISGADAIFMENSADTKTVAPVSAPAPAIDPTEETTGEEDLPEKSPAAVEEKEQPDSEDAAQPEQDAEEAPEDAGDEAAYEGQSDGDPEGSGGSYPPGGFSFNRAQWMDLLKWAHHSGALSQDQRLKIVRMGRLIQKDRRLTQKQQEQISELIAVVYALGYRPQ